MKRIYLLLAALLVVGTTTAFATDGPEVTDATYQQGLIEVDWKHTVDLDDVTGYTVYGYGPTGSGDVGLFELSAGSSSDYFIESDNGTHYFSVSLRANYIPKKVYVSAHFENGDSIAGRLVAVYNPTSDPSLEFHVQSTTVESGEEYTYIPQLPYKKNNDIVFELDESPDGMTINEATGAISWTPSESQEGKTHLVMVTVAYEDGSGSYTTEWLLTVRGCVSGLNINVVDEYEESVKSGVVTVWKATSHSGNEPEIVSSENYTGGLYSLFVEEGVYYVQYSDGRLYEEVWYDGAPTIHNAKPLEVTCETESLTVTLQTSSKQQEEMMTFTGTVTIQENPAQGMLIVEFIGLDPELPESMRWEQARYFTTLVGMTPTGISTYRIDVPAHLYYYASVRSKQNGGLSITTEYFREVTDLKDAEIIESNNTQVNFTPEISAPGRVGFKGYVEGLGEGPVKSKVVATRIMQRSGQVFFERFITTTTGDSAMYIFENLPAGDYVAQAIPVEADFLPGYYSDENNYQAVQSWQDATIITVSDACLPQMHPIILEERTIVSQEEDRTVSGGIGATPGSIKNTGGEVSVESPVGDAVVVVRGMGLSVYTMSNEEGLYNIGQLEPGTYELTVDKPNFDKFVTSITIGEEQSGVRKDIELVGTITDVESDQSKLTALYNDGSNVYVTSDEAVTSIRILNMRGEEIVRVRDQHSTDIRSLSSGGYIVQIQTVSTVETHLMTIVR